MDTVPFSRQEMVNMARRAGPRDAAGQAMRDLPGPVDLDQAEARGHGTAAPETISPAAWAAAITRSAGDRLACGMPPPRLPWAVSMSVNADGAGRDRRRTESRRGRWPAPPRESGPCRRTRAPSRARLCPAGARVPQEPRRPGRQCDLQPTRPGRDRAGSSADHTRPQDRPAAHHPGDPCNARPAAVAGRPVRRRALGAVTRRAAWKLQAGPVADCTGLGAP